MNAAEAAVADVLVRHERALNASDAGLIPDLYAADGVFMPNNGPTTIGAPAVGNAYRAIFEAVALRLEFSIDEIRQISPGWAFARTHCIGTSQGRASGETNPERNQELALFQLIDGRWKIARYCFSTTIPRGLAGNGELAR
jgi:uncharacterized protein (TIGR02246 family)